jgi:hypothetical protein
MVRIIGSTLFAALIFAMPAAHAQNGKKSIGTEATMSTKSKWCLKNQAGGPANCTFASKESCQKVARPEGDDCILNPKPQSTTGSGSSSGRK